MNVNDLRQTDMRPFLFGALRIDHEPHVASGLVTVRGIGGTRVTRRGLGRFGCC